MWACLYVNFWAVLAMLNFRQKLLPPFFHRDFQMLPRQLNCCVLNSCFLQHPGSWCRNLVVLEHQVLKIPAGLPVEAAATVSVNPCTAFRLLKDFEDLQPGEQSYSHVVLKFNLLALSGQSFHLIKSFTQRHINHVGPGIEPGPHWWEVITLSTAPSLLPRSSSKWFKYLSFDQ